MRLLKRVLSIITCSDLARKNRFIDIYNEAVLNPSEAARDLGTLEMEKSA